VYPILNMLFNNSIVNSNQTINLINDFTNKTIPIVCASINSKPNVTLVMYDSNTLTILSNDSNSIIESSCNNSLCTNILQLNFGLKALSNLTSISCSAKSTNQQVPLILTISRNISIQTPSN